MVVQYTSAIPSPETPPPHQPPALAGLGSQHLVEGIDIDAWTVQALESLSVSPAARGIGAPLTIPLDDDYIRSPVAQRAVRGPPPRRTQPARDSLRRREALLKGKEGSRQRRRWENGN
jgi:hypothetical protein